MSDDSVVWYEQKMIPRERKISSKETIRITVIVASHAGLRVSDPLLICPRRWPVVTYGITHSRSFQLYFPAYSDSLSRRILCFYYPPVCLPGPRRVFHLHPPPPPSIIHPPPPSTAVPRHALGKEMKPLCHPSFMVLPLSRSAAAGRCVFQVSPRDQYSHRVHDYPACSVQRSPGSDAHIT